jgi:hypothetical protein
VPPVLVSAALNKVAGNEAAYSAPAIVRSSDSTEIAAQGVFRA